MKKFLMACSLFAMAATASAQNLKGTSINDRIGHGQDSLAVLENLSLYQDYFKQKNYKEAIEPWEYVFTKAPLSMVRVYTDGAWIFETLIQKETDAAKKNEYFSKLMNIYDQREKNLDALNSFATPKTTSTRGNIICRKAYDYYYYCPNMNNNEAYKMFKQGIEDMGPNTEAFVLYGFIECAYNRYMQNKDNVDIRQDFIQDYMLCNEICDRLLQQANEFPSTVIPADPNSEDSTKWVEQVILDPQAEKIIQNYYPTQEQCNNLFVQSGAADCDALEGIYAKKVEENKTDINYLNAVLAILTNFDCDKSNIYYTAADYAYQITKTPQAAIGKASRLLKEGKETEAITYFNEAIELEDNIAKKAKYSYIVAALMYKKGNASGCLNYINKTLQYNPSNGGAYLLKASIVARSGSHKDIMATAPYCLAIDICNKAKAVDPSCAAKANRAISSYTANLYPKSEGFMAGIKAGTPASTAYGSTTIRFR